MTMEPIPPEDLALIKDQGVPVGLLPEFVEYRWGDSIRLNSRGRRFYRLALLLHGLSPDPVEHVRDLESLQAISLRVKQMRLLYERDALERARDGGRVPVKARPIVEAALYGTIEDLHAAVESRLRCEAAGANVIPGSFRRRAGERS